MTSTGLWGADLTTLVLEAPQAQLLPEWRGLGVRCAEPQAVPQQIG